jgi:DNA-binding transcriptional LysR family regulator
MIGTESWKFVEAGKTQIVHPQGRFKADSAGAIAEGVAAGIGIAALPDAIAEPYVAAGRLVAIMENYALPSVGIFVVRPPGHHLARKVRVLTDLLIEHFGRAPSQA